MNVRLCAGMLVSGCQFGKLYNFFKSIGCHFVSRACYDNQSANSIHPAIKLMFSETQQRIFEGLRCKNEKLTLIGDAQADSPGKIIEKEQHA
jgi:hypothetical protein